MAGHYLGCPAVTPGNGVVTVPCTYTYQQENYGPPAALPAFPPPVYSPPVALTPVPVSTYQAYLMPGPQPPRPPCNYPHVPSPVQTKQPGQQVYVSQVKVSRQTWSGQTVAPGNQHDKRGYNSRMLYNRRDTTPGGKPKFCREKLEKLMMEDNDYAMKCDRLYRTFSILFKVYGTMEATNEKIINRFLHLRDEDRKFIMAHGNLESFLISSEYFEKDDGRIVLKCDVPLSTGVRYEVLESTPGDEELLISGEEVEEYEISEYVERSEQHMDKCGQYAASVQQFVGKDMYASSNQPYHQGQEFLEQYTEDTEDVHVIANGVAEIRKNITGVDAEEEEEEVNCEQFSNTLGSSIEDWVNGIDLRGEMLQTGSEVNGVDTPAERTGEEEYKVNRTMTFEQAMENGVNVQNSKGAHSKDPILLNARSGHTSEGTASIVGKVHIKKEGYRCKNNNDILSNNQETDSAVKFMHKDLSNAYLGKESPVLENSHFSQESVNSFHCVSDNTHTSSPKKNSGQNPYSEGWKTGLGSQQQIIRLEKNVRSDVEAKDGVAEYLPEKKAFAVLTQQKGEEPKQDMRIAATSGEKAGEVMCDNGTVKASSASDDIDEVDGTHPEKTSKQLAQEIMDSIFDTAYCKAERNLKITKGKSATLGSWSTWSVQTDCEDYSSNYSAANKSDISPFNSIQRSQTFCHGIVLDTVSKSCNLAEKSSPKINQKAEEKQVETSPSPLSKSSLSVRKLSPHAVEFTPSFCSERSAAKGRPTFTDMPPAYRSGHTHTLTVSPMSTVSCKPLPSECWKKKVPLSTKETQTGSHYHDILQRAITAEKRVVKLQGQLLGMLLRQEFQKASFQSAWLEDSDSTSFARLKQECKKIKTQVSFHASAIERGLSLEELPSMEVWLTLNGVQKNLTVDEDANIFPSHEEMSLAITQQNVQRSGEKPEESACGYMLGRDRNEDPCMISSRNTAPSPQALTSVALTGQTSSVSSSKLQSTVLREPLQAGATATTSPWSSAAHSYPNQLMSKGEGSSLKQAVTFDENVSYNAIQGETRSNVNGQILGKPDPTRPKPGPSVEAKSSEDVTTIDTPAGGTLTTEPLSVQSVQCLKSPMPESEFAQPHAPVPAASENMKSTVVTTQQGVPSGLVPQSAEGQGSPAVQNAASGQPTTSSVTSTSSSKRKTPVDVNFLMEEVKFKLLSRYPFLGGQPEVLASLVAQQTAILQYYMAQGITNPSAGSGVNMASVRVAAPPQAPPGLTTTDMVNAATTNPASSMCTVAPPSVAASQTITLDRRDTLSGQSSSGSSTEAPSLVMSPRIPSVPCNQILTNSSAPGLSNFEDPQFKLGSSESGVPPSSSSSSSSSSLGSQNQPRTMNIPAQPALQSNPGNNEVKCTLVQPMSTVAQVGPRNAEVQFNTHQSPSPGTYHNLVDSCPSENKAESSGTHDTSSQPSLTMPQSKVDEGCSNTIYQSTPSYHSNPDNSRTKSSIFAGSVPVGLQDSEVRNPGKSSSLAPGFVQSQTSNPVRESPSPSQAQVPRQSSNACMPEVLKNNSTQNTQEHKFLPPNAQIAPNQIVPRPLGNQASASENVIQFPLLPRPSSGQPWMQQFQSYYPASGPVPPKPTPPGWQGYSNPLPMTMHGYGTVPFHGMGNWRNPTYPPLRIFQNMPGRSNGSGTWAPPNSEGSYSPEPQRPNSYPGFGGHQMQPCSPEESSIPQDQPMNTEGKGDSPLQPSEWPGLPQPQYQRPELNKMVQNWRDCLKPELPIFQRVLSTSKSEFAPQNSSSGGSFGEIASESQKESWDDVEDFPELKVCGYDPKRELNYGTASRSANDQVGKSRTGSQVTNIPGLTGAMLDGIRRQAKRNSSAPGSDGTNSQRPATTALCPTAKAPKTKQDTAYEKSARYKSAAADDTNPLLTGNSTRGMSVCLQGAGGEDTSSFGGKRSCVSSKAAAADETNPLLMGYGEKGADKRGGSSADGLTSIRLDDQPEPEDSDKEWTQVIKKKRKDTSSASLPKSKKKGETGATITRPYIPGMNYTVKPAQQNKASNFERLIDVLQQRFPQLSRSDLIEVIQQVRGKKGSLTGLSMEQIVEECRPYSERKINMKTQSPVNQPACHDLTPISPTPINHEDVDNCVICFDDLTLAPIKTLECGHKFHEKCIKCWVFTRERTCPTCRQHALFPEEFPKLGKD